MSTRAALGRNTRPKKLSPKQNVPIHRESEVDLQPDLDPARVASTVETGVEKGEESEYHLQQAITAAQEGVAGGKVPDAYIPTPPTIASEVKYDVLYPPTFQQPATYIRSSATVEDQCSGSAYCMDEVDEIVLLKFNGQLPNDVVACSEDQFEEIMSFFEETSRVKQPYARVDNTPVLSLEEMSVQVEESSKAEVKKFAAHFYAHWKSRRQGLSNHDIQAALKAETGQDTDDADPYVCFRRREIRQVRKTRHRDMQSADKLRRLRRELEEARQLTVLVHQRENLRREALITDKQLFQQRADVKETKRKLGIKGDDDDLIQQKPKKKVMESPGQGLTPQMRFPIPGRLGPGEDMVSLDDWYEERQKAIERDIHHNVLKHIRWNEGYVDKTKAPLTAVSPTAVATNGEFRKAIPSTEYLPTPPASVGASSPAGEELADPEQQHSRPLSPPLRYASPGLDENTSANMPSFRRRLGRGGRVMFDRRFPFRQKELDTTNSIVADRSRFDSDDEQITDEPIFDPLELMNERAFLFTQTPQLQTARRLNEAAAAAAANHQQAQTNHH